MAGQRYIVRECLISAVINGVMSTAAFVIVFGSDPATAAVAVSSFTADFAVQGGVIGLAATVIPGLLARRAALRGQADPRSVGSLSGSELVSRALGVAALAAGLSIALWWAGLTALAVEAVPIFAGGWLKAGYGAALAVVCTWSVLRPRRRMSGI